MFNNQQFYHKHTKKAIIAFGTIFNSINIRRLDSSGNLSQSIRVPLAYSPKQKFLSRIAQIPTAESRGEVAITLPRMGFEILGFNFDSTRKLSPVQKTISVGSDQAANTYKRSFVSTPYDMQMGLYIFAKNQEDALQIVEQILPYFNPDFSVTVNDLPELGIKRDIKIVMDSVTFEDDYEGDFDTRRSIIWTMTFTMKLNYYGFVGNQGFIKKSIAKTYENADLQGPHIRNQFEIAPTVATGTATISDGSLSGITIDYGGEGYSDASPPNITIDGNARAHAETTNGIVTKIVIDDAGSGYVTAPSVTFENPPDFKDNPFKDDPYRFIEEFEQVYE